MTVTAKWYPHGFRGAMNQEFNFIYHPIKVMLLDDSYEIDLSTHSYVSDLEGEVEGDGYDAGGLELENKYMNYTEVSNILKMDADDVVWDMLRTSFKYAIIYDDEEDDPEDKLLLGYIDFGELITLNGDKLVLIWSSEGILSVDLN